MPTYPGWTIVTMPSTPSAVASLEVTFNDAASMNVSPFTGNQQTYYWNPLPRELHVALPAMPQAKYLSVAQAWVNFLNNSASGVAGIANVFTFSPIFCATYPDILTSDGSTAIYWRMKSNQRKISLTEARFYGIAFDCMQAM